MLIAVDTNVLIDQALGTSDVLEALEIIRERLNASTIVTPTVLEELARLVWLNQESERAKAARNALSSLLAWGYEPLNLIPVGKGVTEQISLKLRMKGVLPDEEINDSFIVAEAALLGCGLLLTSDKHMLSAQENPGLRTVLKECDVEDKLVIARPRTIAQKFFRTR